MVIRPATLEDAHAIAGVHVTSWHETYTGIVPDSYLSTLKVEERERLWITALERGQTVFVAEVDGRIVGFASAGRNRDKSAIYPGELYAIYLLKAFHKRGLGKRLFNAARAHLAGQSLLPFVTFVLADNPTLGFYKHMGARAIGEHGEDFDGCKLNEWQLLWE